jgi:8-oxo-dGTP pyrophosphatase MutT (NUDIX family)
MPQLREARRPEMAKQRKTRTDVCAGGVVYREAGDGVEIALGFERDRLRDQSNTRLPKGHVEKRETLETAALREVREEIGIAAEIIAPLGSVEYTFQDERTAVTKTVHFFLMRSLDDTNHPLDGEMLRVHWSPIACAVDELTFDTEQQVVRRAQVAIADTDRSGANDGP